MTDTTAPPDVFRTSPKRLALAWLVAIAVASFVNSAIYLVARATGAIPDDLTGDAADIILPTVLTVTILTISIATLAFGIFARFTKKPVRNFTILAVLIVLLTLRLPSTLQTAPAEMVVSLLAMHLVTAVIAWWALTQISRVN